MLRFRPEEAVPCIDAWPAFDAEARAAAIRARAGFEERLRAEPGCLEALLGLARAALALGERERAEAYLTEAQGVDEAQPAVWLTWARSAALAGDHDAARAHARRALALDPEAIDARVLLAELALSEGYTPSAVKEARQAVDADPDRWEGHALLGAALALAGEYSACVEPLEHGARRYHHWRAAEVAPRVSALRLRHDAAQLRFLCALGKLAPSLEVLADVYCEAAGGRDGEPWRLQSLTDELAARVASQRGASLHLPSLGRQQGAVLAAAWDRAEVARAYRTGQVATFDGLLTPKTLDALYSFCLEGTFWEDLPGGRGVLAVELTRGLGTPLLLQIVEELGAALPGVVGCHGLAGARVVKSLDDRPAGGLRRDDAAVALHVWLTPDEANLSSEGGGLVVYGALPPRQWGRQELADAAGAQRLEGHCEAQGAGVTRVPYRRNRAVLFDARLIYQEDAAQFAPDYSQHKLELCLLFGRPRSR